MYTKITEDQRNMQCRKEIVRRESRIKQSYKEKTKSSVRSTRPKSKVRERALVKEARKGKTERRDYAI